MRLMSIALCGVVAGLIFSTAALAGVDMNAVAQAASRPVAPGAAASTYTIETLSTGATAVTVTRPEGLKYILINDQCVTPGTPPTGCDRLAFLLIFNITAGDFSYETLNAWNANRPPQAFKAPDGRTMMIHYVLVRDGMTAGNLAQNLEFWNNSLIAFNNYLANAPKGVTISVSATATAVGSPIFRSLFEHGAVASDAGNERLALPD